MPSKPGYAVPVTVAEPPDDEDIYAYAGRERAARLENARRLVAFGKWYDGVASDMGPR